MKVLGLFSSVWESLATSVWVLDKDLRVSYMNSSFEQLTGYAKEECVGNTSTEERTASVEELTANAQELANMAENLDQAVAKFKIVETTTT